MGTIVGRGRELERLRLSLDLTAAQRVARIVRITGGTGYGKTAIARACADEARTGGWLAPYVDAHRIQTTLPLAVARRLAREIVHELGEGSRYESGLSAALESDDAKAFEAALFRLVDAVLTDRSVYVTVDDAQWADAESRSLMLRLVQNFADRPILVTIVERSGEATDFGVELADETIVVNELDRADAISLARFLMPDASDAVVRAVAEHTRGRAVDIATVASLAGDQRSMTPDSVAESMRNIIAKDLAALKGPHREFLQVCAIIGDPIDYELLNALWPDRQTLAFIAESSGRYLVQSDDGLRFVHGTIAESIRETVAIEIPYRKRIIAAIEQLGTLTPERYERLVEQAAACGDRALERSYLIKLADEAGKTGALPLVASSLERIIPLTPFGEEALAFYSRLSVVYNALNREDTIRVSREALDLASSAGIRSGLGQLVASLLFSLWHSGDREDFDRTLARYDEYLTAASDRAHLASVRMYAAACDFNAESFAAQSRELASLSPSSPVSEVRTATFEAMIADRSGDRTQAQRLIERSRSIIERSSLKAIAVMVDSLDAILLQQNGAEQTRLTAALRKLPQGDHLRASIEGLTLLGAGSATDAIEIVSESLAHEESAFGRRVLFGVAGAASVMGKTALPASLLHALQREAGSALQSGRSPALVPILCAAAALETRPTPANEMMRRALEIARYPFDPQIFWIPAVLVAAAEKHKNAAVLRAIADAELPCDQLPWSVAHHRLAVNLAKRGLGSDISQAELAHVERAFTKLGAPFWATLLSAKTAAFTAAAGPANDLSKLTRRERDVAQCIAGGRSNREIAELLVLSERTVEGHVANIFNKLNVGSRSQVAVWYVSSQGASAPS